MTFRSASGQTLFSTSKPNPRKGGKPSTPVAQQITARGLAGVALLVAALLGGCALVRAQFAEETGGGGGGGGAGRTLVRDVGAGGKGVAGAAGVGADAPGGRSTPMRGLASDGAGERQPLLQRQK